MINFIKEIFISPGIKKQAESNLRKTTLLKESLIDNLIYFRKEFDSSSDLTIRELTLLSSNAAVITIEGMVDKHVLSESVLNPIIESANLNLEKKNAEEKFEFIRDKLMSTSEQISVYNFEEAFGLIMNGFMLLAIDGIREMLAVGIQGFSFRSISEPRYEPIQRGPKDGFVEPLRINMTLIRRRIKSPKLKFETITAGSSSNTQICICYLRDVVSTRILNRVRQKLNTVDLETILASGYISSYMENSNFPSFFSSVGYTERPDTACGKIAEGRICILVDGTPTALLIPYLFVEYFQTMDDYSSRTYYATFNRWLKYVSIVISMLLPGFYVAIGTFNPEVFSNEVLNKIAKSIALTPFPIMVEALIIHFLYEVIREAGLRIPGSLSQSVSIVGGLVIGETAVAAGIISTTTLMVLAITAISSYVIPRLYEPVAFLRLIFILIGGLVGIWGIMLFSSVIIVSLCAKESYGVPFTSPVSPFNILSTRDVPVRASWRILSKKQNNVQNMPGSNVKNKKGSD